jgi:uncharacterized membrane protein YhaH (DUF805 family)
MIRRVGRILFWIGVLIIGAVSVLGVVAVSVSALAGSSAFAVSYGNYAGPLLIIGVLLLIVGLVAVLLPRGFSQDGLWALKLGPYLR